MKMSFEKLFFLAFFPKRNDIVNEVDKKLAHKAKPFGACAAGGWALPPALDAEPGVRGPTGDRPLPRLWVLIKRGVEMPAKHVTELQGR